VVSILKEKNSDSGVSRMPALRVSESFASMSLMAWLSLLGALSVQLPSSTSFAQESAKTTTLQKPVVLSTQTQGVQVGSTFVSFEKGLESIARGGVPRTLAELHALERQQEKVASEINKVTVNVQQGSAQGSGVIITAEGLVLTAAHVAGKPGSRVKIYLADGRRVDAKTLGSNRSMDAGLLEITEKDGRPWPHASLGKSDDLQLGQWLIAAGHPGGWMKDRPAVIRVGRILQIMKTTLVTDCALIGGDSGGPLFDLNGRLIGIHSRIGTETVDNMHVPIDVFRDSWVRMAQGEAWGSLPGLKPVIGIHGVKDEDGEGPAKVGRVVDQSPAERIGIQIGDVIVSFDGSPITTFGDLQRAVEESMPGARVRIEFERNGTIVRKSIIIGTTE